MIQRMLAIWSLVPLPFLNPAWTSGSSRLTHCWSLYFRQYIIEILRTGLCPPPPHDLLSLFVVYLFADPLNYFSEVNLSPAVWSFKRCSLKHVHTHPRKTGWFLPLCLPVHSQMLSSTNYWVIALLFLIMPWHLNCYTDWSNLIEVSVTGIEFRVCVWDLFW